MQTSEQVKPHITFLPSPGMGHITPQFMFAKRLVLEHGIHVSFLVIANERNHFFRATCPPNLTIINLEPSHDTKVSSQIFSLQPYIEPLKSILIELNPKAMVIGLFTTEAIDVCRELSIPVYSFFPASTVLLAFSLYLPKLDRETEGDLIDLPDPIEVPGCSPVRISNLLGVVKIRKSEWYDYYLFHSKRLVSASGIFINTWENLDSLTLKALRENSFFHNLPSPPIYPIGPLIKDEEILNDKGSEIITWLDKQPHNSVILVAFGSSVILSGEQLIELAWGLEMSGQRFIFVVRRPIDTSNNTVNFKIEGEENYDPAGYLPEGFLEKTTRVGHVVSTWFPQVTVLRHPSMGAFLSHCGWNSTLEGISNGVPIIALPIHAEQHMNAAMLVEETRVAVRLTFEDGRDVVGRNEVEKVVRMVIQGAEGDAMRSRAQELKQTARIALESEGSSFDSLRRLVQLWKS